jgi:hypothetical protein
MAFSLAIICVVGGFISIFLGYDLAGLAALLIPISVIIGVFIVLIAIEEYFEIKI